MRYIGVDLHTTQVTVCYLKTVDDYEFKQYRLDDIEEFAASLEAEDELWRSRQPATRWWLVSVVEQRVARVAVVNPSEFEVVKRSVKKPISVTR